MRLQWTPDGATEGSDTSARCCVKSLLDLFLFLQEMTFRYCSSTMDISFVSLTFQFFSSTPLSGFLNFFNDTLHIMGISFAFFIDSSKEIGTNSVFLWLTDSNRAPEDTIWVPCQVVCYVWTQKKPGQLLLSVVVLRLSDQLPQKYRLHFLHYQRRKKQNFHHSL